MGNCLFGLSGGLPKAIDFEDGYVLKPERLLAEGGFSTIYLARDRGTGRQYTLKVMRATTNAEDETIRNEIRILRCHARSQHIIDLICDTDLRTDDEHQYIYAMPFYQRGTVHAFVSEAHGRKEHVPERMLLSMFLGLCKGLQELHTGVEALPPLCHRDVKPHNVLLDDALQAILIDFGSCQPAEVPIDTIADARRHQELASEHSSLPFRAPELLEVKHNTTMTLAIDIWALGCTLYAMAFNVTPFEYLESKGGNLKLAIMQAKVTFPRGHSYSTGLCNLVDTLIKEQPARRPGIAKVIELTETLLLDG